MAELREGVEAAVPVKVPGAVVCSCMHTTRPTLYLCTDQTLFAVDLVSGFLQGRTTIAQWGKVQQVAHSAAQDFVVCFFDGGVLGAWEAQTLAPAAQFIPEREDERRPCVSCALSRVDPFVFIAAANTRHVNAIDLANRACFKLKGTNKKAVVALAVHPSQPILAAVGADGEVRLWDYQSQVVVSAVEGAMPPSQRYFVAFDGAGRHLVVAAPSGHVCAWGTAAATAAAAAAASASDAAASDECLAFLGSAVVPGLASAGFEALHVHPLVTAPPMVLTADRNGVLSAWDLVKADQPKQPVLRPSARMAPFSFRSAVASRAAKLPPCARSSLAQQSDATPQLLVHPTKSVLTCLPHATFELGGASRILTFDFVQRTSFDTCAAAPLPQPSAEAVVWGEQAFAIAQPVALFLGVRNDLWAHNLATSHSSLLREVGVPSAQARAIALSCSYKRGVAGVVFEAPPNGAHHCAIIRGVGGAALSQEHKVIPGKSIFFAGADEEEAVVLSDLGNAIEIGPTDTVASVPLHSFPMKEGVQIDRLFPAPFDQSVGLAVVAVVKGASANAPTRLFMAVRSRAFTLDHAAELALLPGETPLQLVWQRDDTTAIGALLTSKKRIVLVTPGLTVLRSVSLAQDSSPIRSVFWSGLALLFSTDTHIKALYADGTVVCLLSLNTRFSAICGLLPDRVLLCSCGVGGRTMYSRPLSMLDPVLSGELAFNALYHSPTRAPVELAERIRSLLVRFEWQRVSRGLVDRAMKSGFPEIALALASHPSAIDVDLSTVFDAAVASGMYDRALEILSEEAVRSGELRNSRHHPLKNRLRAFALEAAANGHPDVARKCLESFGDTTGLLFHALLAGSDLRSIAGLAPMSGVADAATLAAVSKHLQAQSLQQLKTPAPAATSAGRVAFVTPATRVSASVKGSKHPRMIWVDNPRHWFPAAALEQQQSVSDQSAARALVSPSPVRPADPSDEMLRLVPFLPVPPVLKDTDPEDDLLNYSVPDVPKIDDAQAAVTEQPLPLDDDDADLELDIPPLHRQLKKAQSPIFRPQPYAIKGVAPAPETPAPRPPVAAPPQAAAAAAAAAAPAPAPAPVTPKSEPMPLPPQQAPPMPSTSPPRPLASSSGSPSMERAGWSRAAASPGLSRTASIRGEMSGARSKTSGSPSLSHRVVQTQQKPPAQQSASGEAVLNSQEYKEARSQLMQQWNSRQYDLCLKSIALCIKIVGDALGAKPGDSALQKEIRQVVAYRVAVALLKEIIALSSSSAGVAEIALLTKFLADLPLHAQHRLDCIRLAIDKNMAAKNFGVAARLIQVLMPHNLPDSKEQAEKFKMCKAHKWSDHQLPQYTCPACGQRLSPASAECQQCGTPVNFCCASFKLLVGPVICKCPLCDSPFNLAKQPAGSKCPLCETSALEEFNLENALKERQRAKAASSPPSATPQSAGGAAASVTTSAPPSLPSLSAGGRESSADELHTPRPKSTAINAAQLAADLGKSDLHLQGAADDGDQDEEDEEDS